MLLAFAISVSALAADAPEVGIQITPLVAVDTAQTQNEDHWESWTWIRASAKQKTENGRWFIAINADHNLRSGEDTEGLWHMAAGESGWAGSVGPTHLRVGVLNERWGKLDLLPTIDVLNPRDLRAGPLATIESSRIPIPMMTIQAGNSTVRGEVTYAPFPEGDHIQMTGSDWSVIRPGMIEKTFAGIPNWAGADNPFLEGTIKELSTALTELEPSTQRALGGALQQIGNPENYGHKGNISGRIEVEGPGIDAALVAANIRSPMPVTKLSKRYREMLSTGSLPAFDQFEDLASEDPITSSWPRTWMTGAELSTVLGPIGVRAEGGWWSKRVVQQTWLDSTTTPSVSSGLGLDYASGSIFFLGLEGRWQHLLEAVPRPFFTRKDVFEVGSTLRLSVLNERLQIQTAGLFNLTFEEWLARPEIRWISSDHLSVGIGAVLIDGPTPPPKDLVTTLAYTGGPLSLMRDNDSVFFTLRWTQ